MLCVVEFHFLDFLNIILTEIFCHFISVKFYVCPMLSWLYIWYRITGFRISTDFACSSCEMFVNNYKIDIFTRGVEVGGGVTHRVHKLYHLTDIPTPAAAHLYTNAVIIRCGDEPPRQVSGRHGEGAKRVTDGSERTAG